MDHMDQKYDMKSVIYFDRIVVSSSGGISSQSTAQEKI